jgi:hypothetical protein
MDTVGEFQWAADQPEVVVSKKSLINTSPELFRVHPSSGKLLASYPMKRWVPPHLPTVPEHCFRESSQMATHDSFARTEPEAQEARNSF